LTPAAANPVWLRDRFSLTSREVQFAKQLSLGQTNTEIALSMGVTAATVRRHTEHVLAKLGVASRSAIGARIRRGD